MNNNFNSYNNIRFDNIPNSNNNINNFPQERPNFVNPFQIYHNNIYPSFDDNNNSSNNKNNNFNNNFNSNNNNYNTNSNNFNNNFNTNTNNSNNNINFNNSNNYNNNNNYNDNNNYRNNNFNNSNLNNNNYHNNSNNNFNNNYNNNNNNNNNSNNNAQNNYNNNFNNYNNNNYNNNFNNNIPNNNNFNNNIQNNNNINEFYRINNYNISNNNNKNNWNIINNNEISNKNNSQNDINDFEIINDNFYQDLVRTMSVINPSKNKTWKDNLKSFVSTLFYNNTNFSIKFERDSIRFPLYIFDKRIDNIIRDEIKYPLKTFLYMSYKSGFNNLSNIGCQSFTSDCGWGCMLRCCQMLLSKALIQKKIYDFFMMKNNALIDGDALIKIRNEVLNLFNDNYLSIEVARESQEYTHFWKLFQNFLKSNFIYNSTYEIIPPYSIHVLSKLGNCAGVYTSDQKMIKLICQINSSIFNSLNFVHFTSGNISRKKLISSFCEECINFSPNDELVVFNGVDYKFIKSGVIFISMRLGLQNLDESFYDFIPLIFKKIRHNFGLVGGRKNRAYYFIGIQNDNKLIFSDPHLNQEITGDVFKDIPKYYNENLYLMDIKEMSSSFSFAVGIFNKTHLEHFLEDISWFNNSKFNDCLYFGKN